MNVALVNLPGEDVAGGCEVVVAHTTQLLRAARHTVTVYDHRHPDAAFAAAAMQADEAATRHVLAAALARTAPDVIHIHNLGSRLILEDLIATGRAVRTLHDVGGACPTGKLLRPDGTVCPAQCCHAACALWRQPRRWLRWQRQRERNRQLPLIVPSEFMRQAYARAGYDLTRITVIPHCFPGAEINVPTPQRPLALFVGRLQPEKGLDDFLALLPLLPAGAQLAVCGNGDLAGRVRELAAAHPAQLTWDSGKNGVTRDRLLRACCCLVMPSHQPESFGLVGFLAATYARPTVAYDVGAVGEWLDGDDLIPAGNRTAFHGRVRHYLDDPAAAGQAGLARQQRYITRFPTDRYLDQLLAAYAQVARP
ncbi:MAG TPA: glycosyltransferase family 4 protein [bacterium]|nr:glycosyltransferase family 4 protein [bacterium]